MSESGEGPKPGDLNLQDQMQKAQDTLKNPQLNPQNQKGPGKLVKGAGILAGLATLFGGAKAAQEIHDANTPDDRAYVEVINSSQKIMTPTPTETPTPTPTPEINSSPMNTTSEQSLTQQFRETEHKAEVRKLIQGEFHQIESNQTGQLIGPTFRKDSNTSAEELSAEELQELGISTDNPITLAEVKGGTYASQYKFGALEEGNNRYGIWAEVYINNKPTGAYVAKNFYTEIENPLEQQAPQTIIQNQE